MEFNVINLNEEHFRNYISAKKNKNIKRLILLLLAISFSIFIFYNLNLSIIFKIILFFILIFLFIHNIHKILLEDKTLYKELELYKNSNKVNVEFTETAVYVKGIENIFKSSYFKRTDTRVYPDSTFNFLDIDKKEIVIHNMR